MRINGNVMSRDMIVAEIKNGSVVSMDEARIPFKLRSGDFNGWLSSRAIDSHRTNSRLLKKALRLTNLDDAELVLNVNACTITDTYWFRPEGSHLKYDDVRFTFNQFDKLALYGDPDSFNNPNSRTPELTNIGSFEKCWRFDNGEWWMYKQGSDTERFSELFTYKLGCALGFDMAEYALDGECIKSRDFTKGARMNFEAADGLVGSNDDYAVNFEAFLKLSPECARGYLAIIYLDTLVFNMDRHTQNYGVLRDVDSGRVICMAPNFDNNIALISRGYHKNILRDNDMLIKLFTGFLAENGKARELFAEINRHPVTTEILVQIADSIPINVDKEHIVRFIRNGEEKLS